MSVLLTRGTRLSQPPGPVEVDWSNPIARGLVSAFNPSGGLKGFGGSLSGVPSSVSPTPVGLGYYASSAGTTLSVPGNVRDAIFAAGEATCVQILVGGSTADQGAGTLGSNTDGDHYPYGGLLYLAGFTNTRIINGIAPVVDIMRPHVFAVQGKNGSHRITQNGKVLGTSSIGFSPASTIRLNLSQAGSAWHYRGGIVLHCLWNRYLSDAEIASISANPWQLFKPVQRRVWFDASAGGGGTAYTLTADVGAYSLSGIDAGIIASRRLTADVGSYGLTGQDATLTYTPASGAYTLTADVGTYNLSGVDAGTIAARRVTADVGSYGLTGQDAAFVLARRLTADYGAYSLTGQDATLTATGAIAYTLAAEYGSYSIAGQNAELIAPSGIVDTHDGFWNREYRKMFEYGKKKPTIAEVVDEVVKQDPIAAIEAVKPAVAAKIKLPDNNSELVAKIQQSANLQKAIASALIAKAQAQKAIDDDEQDIEDILMLI